MVAMSTGPVHHGLLAVVIACVLTSLSTVVVALRFYSRHYLLHKLSSPDWIMLAGLIATWCNTVVTYYNYKFSDYRHAHDLDSISRIASNSLLVTWIFRLNYMIDHLLIKLSILLFYKYIASSNKHFHRTVNALIAIVSIGSLTMMCVSIFLCHPVSDAWSVKVLIKGFQGIRATQCLDPTILWLFNGAFNLATDAIIWLIPIPFFLHLRSMPFKRRLELSAIFGLGVLAISASAMRLYVLTQWLSTFDGALAQFGNMFIWSHVEQNAGIIAASVPFLRTLVKRMVRATRSRDGQQSPSPAGKLIEDTPEEPRMQRTPIIPSPDPSFGSHRDFRPPPRPLSPISPNKAEIFAIHTV